MLSLILLALVAFWVGRDYLQDTIADKREKAQLARQTELHRVLLAQAPESPTAHEKLGDALRAEGDLPSAVAAYEEALALTR